MAIYISASSNVIETRITFFIKKKKKHFYILVGRTQDKHIKQTW